MQQTRTEGLQKQAWWGEQVDLLGMVQMIEFWPK